MAASGLVDQSPHTRTVVAKPDEKKLTGMFELMGHLEALCAGLSASRMSPQERDALDTLHGEMALIVSAGDRQAYITANERFHAAIYRGSQNPYLEEITLSTASACSRFAVRSFPRSAVWPSPMPNTA